MSDTNLRIWERVEQTDPEFTKAFKGRGGFEGSALNPVYLIRRATELWGPIGDRWGYEILEERYDPGAVIGTWNDAEGKPLDVIRAIIHTIRLKLWYKNESDQECGVTHYGHTEFVYKDSYGIKTDPEAPKKSLTDALKKCLSMLGFSADVFMGKFDDPDYVEVIANKAALEKADNQAEELERQAAEYREWLARHANLIATATSLSELEQIFKIVIRKLKNRKDEPQILAMTRLKDRRKNALDSQSSGDDASIRDIERLPGGTEPGRRTKGRNRQHTGSD